MILQTIISQSNNQGLTDITPLLNVLEVGVDVSSNSIYWFRPYRSSEFPEITCDKDFLFLWSTDHDTGAGGIWWGKGNNLDLSDFEEVGKIIDGWQDETPFLVRFPNDERPIRLYYHSRSSNPINTCVPSSQETNLITTTGGELHLATWTQETNPLGCQGTVNGIIQTHTGYLRFWDLGNGYVGNHHFNGSVPLTFQRSNTTDGLTFTHQAPYTQYHPFLEDGRSYNLSWGEYFKRSGKYYGFVNSADDYNSFSGGSFPTGKLHLVEVNSNLEVTKLIKTLNHNQQDQAFDFFVDGITVHLYRQTGRLDKPLTFYNSLAYSTFDISSL